MEFFIGNCFVWSSFSCTARGHKVLLLARKACARALEMLKTVHEDYAIERTQVFEWFSRFKRDEMSVENKLRPDLSFTVWTDENVEKNSRNYAGRSMTKKVRSCSEETWSDLWQFIDWFLHHDNASAHTTSCVCQVLNKNGITFVSYSPYSPDLAPCDFFISSNKRRHTGQRFANVIEVKIKTSEALSDITEDEF